MTEPPDDREVLLRVARALEAAGVEYALGGSVATGLQGEPRATNDVDFAVRLSEQQVSRLATELGPDFAVDEEGLREAVRRRGSDNIFFLPSALKIDLFVRGGEPFDDSELSRRRLQPIRGDDRAWIATPEDNILRKLVWFRKGGEVSDRQWRDVLGILRLPGHVLDWDYLRQWAPRLGVADLLERVASQA